MRIRYATPLLAIAAIAALLPACTNVRDLGEGNGRYGLEQMDLDIDSILIGEAGSFRDVNHPAEAMVYNESYGDTRMANVQLDVYDGDRWAMANIQFEGLNLEDLEPGETYNFNMRSVDFDNSNDDVNVYGIGCSSTSAEAFDEDFSEVEVTAVEDGEEIMIDFEGRFANGDELAGTFPAASAEGMY